MTLSPVVVAGPEELADAAAAWTAERIEQAAAARGFCYIALAGGESPRGCYRGLAADPYDQRVPWGKVFVYWSDERQVALDDPASNYAMARTASRSFMPARKMFASGLFFSLETFWYTSSSEDEARKTPRKASARRLMPAKVKLSLPA